MFLSSEITTFVTKFRKTLIDGKQFTKIYM